MSFSSGDHSPRLLTYNVVECIPRTERLHTHHTVDSSFQELFLCSWNSCLTPPSYDQPGQISHSDVFGAMPFQLMPWCPVLAPNSLGLSPEQILEIDPPGTTALDRSDGDRWDMFQTLTDDQIHVICTGSVMDRQDSPQLTSDQILGQSVNLRSVQENNFRLGNTAGTHLTSPCQGQRHQNQIVDGFKDSRQVPEMRSAQSVKHGRISPKNWRCSYGDCDKTYQRLQELKRHITDRHETPLKCPICDRTWTRPERIRSHLTNQHQHHFTEEEYQEIRGLRGRKDTIGFLAKCRTTTFHNNNIFQAPSTPSLPQPFHLVDIVNISYGIGRQGSSC